MSRVVTFLKANQKFPDYIEVGVAVWESVVDWHIRHQQALAVSRSVEGHPAPDWSDNYVGPGMDAR